MKLKYDLQGAQEDGYIMHPSDELDLMGYTRIKGDYHGFAMGDFVIIGVEETERIEKLDFITDGQDTYDILVRVIMDNKIIDEWINNKIKK